MKNLLDELDVAGFGTGGSLSGNLPNALTPARAAARHAYQVFSVNSERLNQLNATPFHADVAYAAVVGTDATLFPFMDPFKAFQPNWDPIDGASKPYFPWIYEFNKTAGATDSIVPRWSAELGVASHNAYIGVNHISMGASSQINSTVRNWLNAPMPLGNAQRASYTNTPPVSERNAYQGSTVGANGISTGSGLNPDAIVKVELPTTESGEVIWRSDPIGAGIHVPVLTGMIKVSNIGTTNFRIVADELDDDELDNLGAIPLAGLNIAPSQLVGAGLNDWVAFRNSSGQIGRRQDQYLTGPDGDSDSGYGGNDNEFYVGYEMADLPGGQSPPLKVIVPEYVLPAPTAGGTGGLAVTFTGTVETQNAGTGLQTLDVRLYDQDGGLNPDDLLQSRSFNLLHPTDVWDGLLIPYSNTLTLFLDSNGDVSGTEGTSGENPAQVYQYLVEAQATSAAVNVP